ncbi:Gamma-tubulin complex component 3 [Castilleja foliolosa]|uniref:Gamma-tubulin complex component 3 n=1 Tax=Castilleja foliolosa TaxID=1961234 RepID=A0ABD3B8K4_9LAMI
MITTPTSSLDTSRLQRPLGNKSSESGPSLGEGRKDVTERASEFLRNVGQDIDAIGNEYSSVFEGFISQLPLQQHVDLKFLMFRLDFTEFYSQLRV